MKPCITFSESGHRLRERLWRKFARVTSFGKKVCGQRFRLDLRHVSEVVVQEVTPVDGILTWKEIQRSSTSSMNDTGEGGGAIGVGPQKGRRLSTP